MQIHLSSLQNDYSFALEVRDVDQDPEWAEKFDDKVPVLFWGDQEICRYFLDLVKFKDIFLKNNNIDKFKSKYPERFKILEENNYIINN